MKNELKIVIPALDKSGQAMSSLRGAFQGLTQDAENFKIKVGEIEQFLQNLADGKSLKQITEQAAKASAAVERMAGTLDTISQGQSLKVLDRINSSAKNQEIDINQILIKIGGALLGRLTRLPTSIGEAIMEGWAWVSPILAKRAHANKGTLDAQLQDYDAEINKRQAGIQWEQGQIDFMKAYGRGNKAVEDQIKLHEQIIDRLKKEHDTYSALATHMRQTISRQKLGDLGLADGLGRIRVVQPGATRGDAAATSARPAAKTPPAVAALAQAAAQADAEKARRGLSDSIARGLTGLPAEIEKAKAAYDAEMMQNYRAMALEIADSPIFGGQEIVKQQEDLQRALDLIPGYAAKAWQEAGEEAQAAYERSFGKGMIDATRQTAYNMQSTMGDVFFDAMRGQLKDFSDYWDAFLSSLERTLADTAARMAAQELFGYDRSQAEGGGRDWGLLGTAVSAAGSLAQSSGAWDWLKGAASSAGSWLGLFAEGTPYVPRTGLAGLHQGERVLTSAQNQDLVAAMQFLVGGQVAQTGLDAEIAVALGQIQVNTAETAAGVKGLGLNLGLSMDAMSTAIRVGLSGAAGLGTLALTGSPILGIKAAQLAWGKSGYTADLLADRIGGGFPLLGPGGIGRLIFAGPGYDPSAYRGETPPGYPGAGGSDPWGLFSDIQGSRQEGGEIDVGGLYVMHPNEVVYNGPQQRAFAGRLDRIEAAVAARPAVSPVFQFVNNGVVTTQDADAWFAERIQQYEDQFSAASQDRIQAVATAGVNI